MRKIFLTVFLLFFTIFGLNEASASMFIQKNPFIIPRLQWGADEEITYIKIKLEDVEPKNTDTQLKEGDEQSDIKEQDPDIEKVITQDSQNREYVWPLQYAKEIKFIVVHHTESVKNLDEPIIAIKNTEYYHAVTKGWGDIGYNYLIDQQGNIYEGRKGGEKIIGGHARNVNKVSIGIALLGNYETDEVPLPALNSLIGLVSKKAKLYKLDVTGTAEYKGKTYNVLQGHNESSATICPGHFLKQKLDGIRKIIAYNNKPKPVQHNAQYNFNDFENRSIFAMYPDEEKEFIIKLKNTGQDAWNSSTFLELKNNADLPDMPKVFAKLEIPKVQTGGVGVFRGTLPRTLISGLKLPEVGLAVNGSIRLEKTFPIPFMVSELQNTYEVIGRSDPPAKMKAGETAKAWIILKNTGNFTWKRDGKNAVRIGTSHKQDRKSALFNGKSRIGRLVESEVPPGSTGKFIFNVHAPENTGSYTEYFQPVVEGIGWMLDLGTHFKVAVESAEKPLRVVLSFKGQTAIIHSDSGMKLYNGVAMRKEFTKDEAAVVRITPKGNYKVQKGKMKFILSSPPRFKANDNGIIKIVNYENHPDWDTSLNDNAFRGVIEMNNVDFALTAINELPLEDYLKGLGEVSNGDPPEKIKTIIILARSYANYYMQVAKKFPGKPYDLDDNPDRSQKYIGYGLEIRSPNISAAVDETRGQIVTYKGQPVITPYFNQSDGRTRSALEVWGWTNTPYLQSVPDTLCFFKEKKGHGVGVSGCGATEMAKQGKKAEEIIKYYYQGVEIGKIPPTSI